MESLEKINQSSKVHEINGRVSPGSVFGPTHFFFFFFVNNLLDPHPESFFNSFADGLSCDLKKL